MRRLRVILLATDLQKGGLPLRLVRLARHLPSVDVEPVVGSLAARGPLHDDLDAAGIENFACEAGGSFDLRCLPRLAEHVRRLDPDLIHSSLFHANLAARLFGRLDRRRPVITSTVTIEIQRRWHRLLESLTSGLSDLHVANARVVGRHVREDLGFDPCNVQVIPNGLDFAEIARMPAVRRQDFGLEVHVPLVLWAGRMDPVKNLETFVEVVARVRRRTALQAVLVGDGSVRARIETLVTNRGLTRDVCFVGWSENVVGWLKTADLLLFPSWTEGSPNVVLEAMACACPVVAADVPGCSALITAGRTGSLYAPADAGGLAQCVHDLLNDAERRRRYSDLASKWVLRRHRIQDVVLRWRDAYDLLMRRG